MQIKDIPGKTLPSRQKTAGVELETVRLPESRYARTDDSAYLPARIEGQMGATVISTRCIIRSWRSIDSDDEGCEKNREFSAAFARPVETDPCGYESLLRGLRLRASSVIHGVVVAEA